METELSAEGGFTDQRATPLSYALLLFMGVAWGLAISLAKLAGSHGGHPVGLALWQVCTSGSLLLVLSLIIGPRRRPNPGILRFSLICGAVGVTFPAIALFWSALYLPAGVVALAFASGGHVDAIEPYATVVGAQDAGDAVEKRRLACAAGAAQGQLLFRLQHKVWNIQHGQRFALGYAVNFLEIANLQQRHGRDISAPTKRCRWRFGVDAVAVVAMMRAPFFFYQTTE